MSLFRNSDSSSERSAADRERARLEREARRRGISVEDILRERGELPPEPAPPEPEPAPEPEPVEPEPVAYVPEPEPVAPPPPPPPVEEELTWDEPEPVAPEPEPVAPEPVAPQPDPEPTSVWAQPPAPGPTAERAAPIGEDLPPKELDPPALPARASARPLPRPPRRRYAQADARRSPAQGPVKRKRSWTARIFAVLFLAVVVAALWFLFNLFQPGKGDGSGTTVAVTIPQGATPREIGDLLASKDVVSSGFYFDLRTRLSGNRGDFKAGTFKLHHDMSYGSAMDALTAPQTQPQAPTIKVTIPEGRSRREIAASLKQDGVSGSYLSASVKHKGFDPTDYKAPKDTKSLEGFLFPATYDLPKKSANATTLVGAQLDAFKDNFSSVSLADARKKNLTPYDVLIIASMVEREAQVAKDRPLIAAVIYNRLKDGMPLGIDATTRYELNDWSHPLKESQLTRDSPYNTRTRRGLPPTPIGNPGLASIKAAAHPAKVSYLYYVAKPGTCGQHAFSSTDAQFQRDVQAYNAARAANGGQSPDTC